MSNRRNKNVCFAEVPEAMRGYKENLIKELEECGWIIKEVSNAEQHIEKAFEIIDQCEIVIHILGDKDHFNESEGKILEEQQIDYSLQHLKQQKLLSESADREIKIFVWYPKSSTDSVSEEENIPEYLQRIQQLDEIEFLRTNYEDFKYNLLSQIEADAGETEDEIQNENNSNLSIYFLYDKADEEIAKKYIDYLNKKKFTVYTPSFEGDIIEIKQIHQNCLMKMDVAIIFAETVSVNWVNMKMMDILKSPGLGKENRILGKAVITSEQNGNALTLLQRGFDFFPLEQNSLKKKIIGFLKTKQLPDN